MILHKYHNILLGERFVITSKQKLATSQLRPYKDVLFFIMQRQRAMGKTLHVNITEDDNNEDGNVQQQKCSKFTLTAKCCLLTKEK